MKDQERQKIGVCPRCFQKRPLKKHYIFPESFFEKNNYYLYLCGRCSQTLNYNLLKQKKVNESLFLKIHKVFLKEKTEVLYCKDKESRTKSRLLAVCPNCFELRCLEKHHIFPKRFFGPNEWHLFLCSRCHEEIEKIIPRLKKLNKRWYLRLHQNFLKDEKIPVIIQQILREQKRQNSFRKLAN